jgi:hypothetical protein
MAGFPTRDFSKSGFSTGFFVTGRTMLPVCMYAVQMAGENGDLHVDKADVFECRELARSWSTAC